MKRITFSHIVSLLLVIFMCFSLFACGEDKDDDTKTPPTESSLSGASNDTTVSSNGTTDSSNDTTVSSNGTTDSSNDTVDSSTGDNPGDGKPDDSNPPVKPDSTSLIPIDYNSMTYVGTSLKSFLALFDEQYGVGDPRSDLDNGIFPSFPSSVVTVYDADGNGDITIEDRAHEYEITIDLGAEHYVESVYAFFDKAAYTIILETGTPFNYDNTVTYTSDSIGWKRIEIDAFTRHINVRYDNGQAATELLVYGARTGEYDVVNTEKHEYKDFSYYLGMNGNQSDKSSTLSCTSYFRDYINWLWCFDKSVFPNTPGTSFTGMGSGYDSRYRSLKRMGIDAVPCFMFGANDFEIEKIEDFTKPESYVMYGEFLFQSALRFGYNANNTKDMIKVLGLQKRFNLDAISWIEAGNEPNGEGNDGFSPYELGALTSTSYDGHCNTVVSPTGSGVGVINANSGVKMAMAGLAGVGVRYIQAMSFWMEYNRPDGQLALDAFNVHTYCKKLITYNGYQVYVGVCPEIGKITEYVEQLCDWRDKYHPDKEVWVTEFGWDTNTSYATENACHPYAGFTARQLQAMWLVRAYFMFASVGVDRAAMYMAPDLGDEATSTGKYGTSGVITSKGEYKDSYYYLNTLKNTMSDMHFAEIIDSGNENVWIYRFENGEGRSCYALWCPTMDDIRVDGYTLDIDGTSATLTQFANLEMSGISSELTVTDGTVTVNVSEVPILVFSE